MNHLWQSTVFAAAIGTLVCSLKRNSAPVRYSLWVAASLKFLLPFSVLVQLGSRLGPLPGAGPAPPGLTLAMRQFGQPFASSAAVPVTTAPDPSVWPAMLPAIWACGCVAVLVLYWKRRRQIANVVQSSGLCACGRELEALRRAERRTNARTSIDLLISRSPVEPGVFGIVRPVLVIPEGLADRLTAAELEAILAHELCHVRHRDNLVSRLHVLVEALFWFHPLVWWLGSRIVEERERSCDEEVLRLGAEAEVYARSILKTCEFHVRPSPLCAAGVTGGNLRQRLEEILRARPPARLDRMRKLLLAAAGTAAVIIPVASGIATAPRLSAQPSAPAAFEAASIKPSLRWKAGGEGRTRESIIQTPVSLTLRNVTLSGCVQLAYGVKFYQVSGPDWAKSDRYDLQAKAAEPVSRAQMRAMLQALLAERFNMVLHREEKEFPIYALVVAKNRPALKASSGEGGSDIGVSDGAFVFQRVSMPDFAEKLSDLRTIDRPVLDRTGIPGRFDITLKHAASAMLQDDGPSIFTLLQEQLGLKLEPQRGPLEVIVIDRAERTPTEN